MTRIETRPVTVMPAAPAQAARVKGAKVGPRDPGGPVEARRERGYAGPAADGAVPGPRGAVVGARTGPGKVLTPRATVPPEVKDVVGAARPATVGSTRSMPTAMARATIAGASPFAGVAARASVDGAVASLQPLAPARALDHRAELPPDVLANIIDLEAVALRGGATEVLGATSNLRKGVMLSAAESPPEVPLDSESLGELAGAVLGGSLGAAERKLAAALPGCIARLPMNVDVNALVQAVLRESYLMQCELLQDFADKVKFYNELKKRIRAELQRARQSLAGASALADDAALGFDYVPAPVDAIEEYGGRAGGGSSWTNDEVASAEQGASTGGALLDGGPTRDGEGAGDLGAAGSGPGVGGAGGTGDETDAAVRGSGDAKTSGGTGPTPPEGAVVWTSESGQEVLDLLAANKTIAVPYENDFIVVSGAPPATTAKLGELVASVTTAVDANGTVLQITKLPGMGDGKGSLRIDATGALRVDAGVPLPAGATEWTGQSADEVINTLRDDPQACFALPYKGKYIVLAGNPPAGKYGSTSLGVTVATTAAGSVIQITGLPDLKAGKGALVLDAEGKLERSQSAPLPAGATLWSGESADEVLGALRDDPAKSFAVPYKGKYIVLAGSPPTGTYGSTSLSVTAAVTGAGSVIQMAGLPDNAGKGALVLDAEGKLVRSQSAPLPAGATLWSGESAEQVQNALAIGAIGAYAIPYAGDFIVMKKNTKESPALVATYKGKPLDLSAVASASGSQLQFGGVPDLRQGRESLILDSSGALARCRAGALPDGTWLWSGEPSDQVQAKLAKGSVAVPYEGGYVLMSGWPATASCPSDPTAKPEVHVATNAAGDLIEITGLPGLGDTGSALVIDAAGKLQAQRGPVQPAGSHLWHDQSAAQIKASVDAKKPVAILYDGKYLTIRKSEAGYTASWGSDGRPLTVAFASREGVQVLEVFGLPGLKPTDYLCIDSSGAAQLAVYPTTLKNAFGMTSQQVLAYINDEAGPGIIGLPFAGELIELGRAADDTVYAKYQGVSVPCETGPNGISIAGVPGLSAADRVVLDPSGRFYTLRPGLASAAKAESHERYTTFDHADWTNSSTFKAETLELTKGLCTGLTDAQKRAVVEYIASHPLRITFNYYVKGDGGHETRYTCPPPTSGESLDDYLARAGDALMSSVRGDKDFHVRNLKVVIENWPVATDESSDQKEDLENSVSTAPVMTEAAALGVGGPENQAYVASGPGSEQVAGDVNEDGTVVESESDAAGDGASDGGAAGGSDPTGVLSLPPAYHEWQPGDPIVTKADLDAYVKSLEEKLNTTGDDAQLASVDLQNALQVQQQTIQMMSNISKMIHDTALAIIRKIGG